MKKINLLAIASASFMMFACTDYEGQVDSHYDDNVKPALDDLQATYGNGQNNSNGNNQNNALSNPNIDYPGCGDLWCGQDGSEGKADLSFLSDLPGYDATSGYWFTYTDDNNGGNSQLLFPADVVENEYGNFFGPLADMYGGLFVNAVMGNDLEFMSAYAGLGFNLLSENLDPADITSWEGLCITYWSDKPFEIELRPSNEESVTEFNNYKNSVPSSSDLITVDIPWSEFEQYPGWGVLVARGDILQMIAAVNIKFTQTGNYFIQSVGRLGTCSH